MEDNFNQKIATLAPQIADFSASSSLSSILSPTMMKWTPIETQANAVIMASILERKSRTSDDRPHYRRCILWKRLSLGIPLELDSTLEYATGHVYINSADFAKIPRHTIPTVISACRRHRSPIRAWNRSPMLLRRLSPAIFTFWPAKTALFTMPIRLPSTKPISPSI